MIYDNLYKVFHENENLDIEFEEFSAYNAGLLVYKYLSKKLSDELNRRLFKRFDISFKEAFKEENIAIYGEIYKKEALKDFKFFIKPEYTFLNIMQEEDIEMRKILFEKALNTIEFQNPQYNNLFSYINFDKLDTLIFNKIITILNSYDLNMDKTKRDSYLNTFNSLLSKNSVIGKLGLSINSINAEYSKLISKILNNDLEDIETIYNPISSPLIANSIKTYGDIQNTKIYGQNPSQLEYSLSIMNFLLNDINIDDVDIREECWLTNNLDLKNQVDVIVSQSYNFRNQTLKRATRKNINNLVKDERFNNYSESFGENARFLYILNMLYYLKNKGIIFNIELLSFLFANDNTRKLRKELVINNLVDTVILLPPERVLMCLIIFKKDKKTNNTLFIDARNNFDSDLIFEIYKNRLDMDNYSRNVTPEEIQDNDFNLSVNRYVYNLEDIEVPNDLYNQLNNLDMELKHNTNLFNEYLREWEKLKNIK